MNATSHIVDPLKNGLVLDVVIEDLQFRAYVVISKPDINLVSRFVPAEQFQRDGDVHVTAIGRSEDAREQIEDMAFNMNPGDAAVFLCGDERAYMAALEELGQIPPERLN